MNAITIVLIAFSAISLVVSVLMIGIITYISVLERTKEIGVLRALGARKKDISRVFNAETFIVGVCSGLLGIGIARLLLFPVNSILLQLTNIENVAQDEPAARLGAAGRERSGSLCSAALSPRVSRRAKIRSRLCARNNRPLIAHQARSVRTAPFLRAFKEFGNPSAYRAAVSSILRLSKERVGCTCSNGFSPRCLSGSFSQ